MISDVLYEAILNIREYQKALPECYAGIAGEINAVVKAMDKLRAKLDAPPQKEGQ